MVLWRTNQAHRRKEATGPLTLSMTTACRACFVHRRIAHEPCAGRRNAHLHRSRHPHPSNTPRKNSVHEVDRIYWNRWIGLLEPNLTGGGESLEPEATRSKCASGRRLGC